MAKNNIDDEQDQQGDIGEEEEEEFDDMEGDESVRSHPDRANIELVHSVMKPASTAEFIEMSDISEGMVLGVSLMLAQEGIMSEMRLRMDKEHERKSFGSILLESLAHTLRGKKRRLIENAIALKQLQSEREGSTSREMPGM